MIRAHPERYFWTDIIKRVFTCWTVAGTVVQQSLALLFNSHWHDCLTVTGTIIQQLLARFLNGHWHNSSTVIDTIVQQWLARFFNSHWHNSSTVTGAILQQWMARLFSSHGRDFFFFLRWQNFSTVMFTAEASCHVTGIRHIIRELFFTNHLSKFLKDKIKL